MFIFHLFFCWLNGRNFISFLSSVDFRWSLILTPNPNFRTLLRFWGVFQFTQVQSLPFSPQKQCWTRVSRIFFRVSTLYRVGGGGRSARQFRKGCTVLRGNRQMTEKYDYCSTVPKTFVQEFDRLSTSSRLVEPEIMRNSFEIRT